MEEKTPSPFFPTSYGLVQIIGISLSVLSLGFAIAFIGYFLAQKQEIPTALSPTPAAANISNSPTISSKK